MIAEGLDKFRLAHRGATLDANLPGPLDQVLLAPVGIGRAPAALAARQQAGGGGRLRDDGRVDAGRRASLAASGTSKFVPVSVNDISDDSRELTDHRSRRPGMSWLFPRLPS